MIKQLGKSNFSKKNEFSISLSRLIMGSYTKIRLSSCMHNLELKIHAFYYYKNQPTVAKEGIGGGVCLGSFTFSGYLA